MKPETEIPASTQPQSQTLKQRILSMPSTRLGWWSVGLAFIFAALFSINSMVFMPGQVFVPWREVLLPFYGILMMACGLAAGIVSLIAVIRHHERSWIVLLPILFGLMMLFLLLGEFLVPH